MVPSVHGVTYGRVLASESASFDHMAPLHSQRDATRRALATCFTPLVFSLLSIKPSPPPPSHPNTTRTTQPSLADTTGASHFDSHQPNVTHDMHGSLQVGSLFGTIPPPESHNTMYRVIGDSFCMFLYFSFVLEHFLLHSIQV